MNYLIIGGSAAGVSAAETLRKHDKKASITLVSDESLPLYSRCLLTYLIAGVISEEKLHFKNKDFYQANAIKTYLGKKALTIDRKKKTVNLEGKTTLSYDRLLLATGALAKTMDLPGSDKKSVFTVRNIGDARGIIAMLDKIKTAVVLGGGLIGLRDAYALALKQKKVAVVVKSPHVLSQMIDADSAGIIAQQLMAHGIEILTGVEASAITGADSVEAVALDNGQTFDCQMVIVGKGVNPNMSLAESSQIKTEEGIVVNEFLQTSDEHIFAAGDVAQTYDITRGSYRINALWPCAVEQGEVAALNMLGKNRAYDGSLAMNSVDFFGLSCISMGITKAQKEEGYEILSKTRGTLYKKILLKENRIVGMVFLDDVKAAGVVSALIRYKVDISSIKTLLLEDNFDYAKIMPLIARFREKFSQEEFQDTMISYIPRITASPLC
ncbi:MAG: FAD-dependent oxidoreductase [Candidatus Omnitrophota bacterium]